MIGEHAISPNSTEISRISTRTTISDLTLEVAAAFYEAVAQEEWVEVRRIVLQENQNQLKVAERRFEVGEIAIAGVARWRAQVAAAKQHLVVATGDAAWPETASNAS